MNSRSSGNNAPEKRSAPYSDDVIELEEERLITFAAEYFAIDFRNPRRVGCPSPLALQRLARLGELPDDELCDHLFGCSECFRDYRVALEARRATAHAGVAASWLHEWRSKLAPAFALKPAFALAFILLLAVSGAVLLAWRDKAPPATPRLAQLQPQPSTTISVPANEEQLSRNETPTRRAGGKTSAPPSDHLTPSPLQVVKADLDEMEPMRSVTAGGAEVKELPPLRQGRVRLDLTLRENSRAGAYRASIVNTAGRSLRTQRAISADGVNLRLEFDLSGLAAGSYYLRLARQGAMPANYPVKLITGDR
jgi:hypothetical protein